MHLAVLRLAVLRLAPRGPASPGCAARCLLCRRRRFTLSYLTSLFHVRRLPPPELSAHPEVDTYTLHLCYLMLIEPLAAPLEQWLVFRSRTSLHFALQVRASLKAPRTAAACSFAPGVRW